MALAPQTAIEAATGTNGSDGLAVFTFPVDIDSNRLVLVDRFPQGETIDFTVTGARKITFIAPSIPVAGSKIWLLNGVTAGTAVTTGLPGWDTVAEIVSDVAIEEGLLQAPITDPYASADPNILQLTALLKSAGRMVVREHGWSHLQREFVFSTVASQAAYPLPSDFREMIEQSGWNRTTVYPFGGPIGAAVWQLTKAFPLVGTLQPFVRFQGGQMSFSPTPTAVQTIAFEYQSWFWVRPVGQTSPSSDTPTAASDTICFNASLMVCALKLAWEKAKRMDTTAAQADYERALASEMNQDSAAPTMILGGSSDSSPAQAVWDNIPQTGIGQ